MFLSSPGSPALPKAGKAFYIYPTHSIQAFPSQPYPSYRPCLLAGKDPSAQVRNAETLRKRKAGKQADLRSTEVLGTVHTTHGMLPRINTHLLGPHVTVAPPPCSASSLVV